ncbi:hypothetical protein GOBAR_DD09069 [Gossypium barbadense]|nr:hypothetical protein GOBAR_DD09069 [Gossypium barbadense]
MDVATDHSNSLSLDYSLSFTSLVCIDPPNHQSNKDQSPHASNKSSRPDSGGGHLLPLEFLLKSRPPSLGGDGERKLNGEVRNQGNDDSSYSNVGVIHQHLKGVLRRSEMGRTPTPSSLIAKSMVFIPWAKTRFWSNGFAQISALFEACLAAPHGFAM